MSKKEYAKVWLFDYCHADGFTEKTLNQLASWIEKAEKLDQLIKSIQSTLDTVDKGDKYVKAEAPYLEADCDLVSKKFVFDIKHLLESINNGGERTQ